MWPSTRARTPACRPCWCAPRRLRMRCSHPFTGNWAVWGPTSPSATSAPSASGSTTPSSSSACWPRSALSSAPSPWCWPPSDSTARWPTAPGGAPAVRPFFGTLALVLAAVGLYGVVAYGTARRTGEIGLRIALGAPRAQVVWMILRDSLLLVALGLAIGLPAALAGARAVQSVLFGIQPADPFTFATTAALLAAIGGAAAFLPARPAPPPHPPPRAPPRPHRRRRRVPPRAPRLPPRPQPGPAQRMRLVLLPIRQPPHLQSDPHGWGSDCGVGVRIASGNRIGAPNVS